MYKMEDIDFDDERIKVTRKPITDEEIQLAMTKSGGFKRETLAIWGVPWPPAKGWRRALLIYGYPLIPLDISSKGKIKKSNKTAIKLVESVLESPQKPLIMRAKRSLVSKEKRDEFYSSWEWRTLRMETIKRYGTTCQCCGAAPGHTGSGGKPTKIVVDHIKPISRYWTLRLDPENLQILCDECNQGKGNWDETDFRPHRS